MAQSEDDEYWQNLSKTYENKFRSLKCYLNDKDVHFLVEPKVLPCSNSACLECIRSSITLNNNTGADLNCSLCKQVHANINIVELKSNEFLIDQIESNSKEISNEMVDKLNKYISSLTDKFANKNELVESLCNRAKKEVSDRVELIKAHLEALYQELVEMLGLIKNNVVGEIDKMSIKALEKCAEYEAFATSMEKMLEDFESNRERLESEIYACQNYIDELELAEKSFQRILRKVTFDASDWSPDEKFLCEYIGKFDINDNDCDNGDGTKTESVDDSDDEDN